MKDYSFITFWNIDWILIEECDELILIPKNEDDGIKFDKYFNERDFKIRYNDSIGFQNIAVIERFHKEINNSIKLFPKYMFAQCHTDNFCGFEITGDAIDQFFSPSSYFFHQRKSKRRVNSDLLYDNEIAAKWTVNFENQEITIVLIYGEILYRGKASDLMLHPKLKISFSETEDIEFIYRVYLFIVRFLKIVRYDIYCGKLNIDLYCEYKGVISHDGNLVDFQNSNQQCNKNYISIDYIKYKPYIQHFLQFAANNPNFTFFHYPKDGIRFLGRDYSAIDYMNIFAAFESECQSVKSIYEKVDTTKIQNIKSELMIFFERNKSNNLKSEEKEFLENAKNRIKQLGTQFSQRKKIVNAYQVLRGAIDSSIKNIFYLPEFRIDGALQIKELKIIAEWLTNQRGTVAHGGFIGSFSDLDAQKIRFLEILTYSQMLKRVGLDDKDIERVIGAVFGCNSVLFNEGIKS